MFTQSFRITKITASQYEYEYESKKLYKPRECLGDSETSSNNFIVIKVVPEQTNTFICLDLHKAKSDKMRVAALSSNFKFSCSLQVANINKIVSLFCKTLCL